MRRTRDEWQKELDRILQIKQDREKCEYQYVQYAMALSTGACAILVWFSKEGVRLPNFFTAWLLLIGPAFFCALKVWHESRLSLADARRGRFINQAIDASTDFPDWAVIDVPEVGSQETGIPRVGWAWSAAGIVGVATTSGLAFVGSGTLVQAPAATRVLSVAAALIGAGASYCLWRASKFLPAGNQPIGGAGTPQIEAFQRRLRRWSALGFVSLAVSFVLQTASVIFG